MQKHAMSDTRIGFEIAGYRIVSVLGQGGGNDVRRRADLAQPEGSPRPRPLWVLLARAK